MNTLIIHSASSKLVKDLIKAFPNDPVFVLTFPKNKCIFTGYAQELYFKQDNVRINAYQVYRHVQRIIQEHKIERIVGLYSNLYGSNYENLRVLFSKIKCNYKEIYNRNLERVNYQYSFKEKRVEFYYGNEKKILFWLSGILKILRIFRTKLKRPVHKIMFVNNTYTIGGVETLLLKWGQKLAQNYEIVCVFDTNGGLYPEYQKSNIKTYLHRENVFDEPAIFGFYSFLKKVLKREHPDVVIIAGTDTIIPATLATVRRRVPLIIKLVNGRLDEIQNSRPTGLQMRMLAGIYDAIVTVAGSVKQDLVRLGIDGELIKVIYGSAIELSSNRKVQEIELSCESKKSITCISRLSPEKGVDVFIQAIALLKADFQEQVEFTIVGDGPERQNLEGLASQLGVSHCVNFLGFRKDIPKIIDDSYLIVLSSHTEGLPVVVLETMANSKVCIASQVGGTPEIIEHGTNGFLFPDNDHHRLAELIEFCIKNEQTLKLMEFKAFDTIRQKFQIDKILNDLKTFLEHLVKNRV